MRWNWEQKDWPNFTFKLVEVAALNKHFVEFYYYLSGTYDHIADADKQIFSIDLLTDEAYKTSEIEGELLNRDSLRSSIRRQLGLSSSYPKILPREQGIAEMMVNEIQTYAQPLTHEMLFDWHLMLNRTRKDLYNIGSYRTHAENMEIVSGAIDRPKIHFVAPPSHRIYAEMEQFIAWFNKTTPQNNHEPLPVLIRAGIAHLYFVSIHPFEDGNGRIARALVEKVLSQSFNRPTLIALSTEIQNNKKMYYSALEQANKLNEITQWLVYFAKTIIAAQKYTLRMIEFLIDKTKFYNRVKDQLNERQLRVIERIFKEGLAGFKGGLSAENYLRITKTSRATATRDLQDMVNKGVLTRTGERKKTRYALKLK